MASLSNFFRPRDPVPPGPAHCRRVERHEIESALRLILADDNGPADDGAILDFLSFAMQRKIDVNQIWIAAAGNQILWALLPITSPGRTMLLFTPMRIPRSTPLTTARDLTHEVCRHWGGQGMQLAQFLLDPGNRTIAELYVSAGFEELAELIYLQRPVKDAGSPAFPEGFEVIPYDESLHAAFTRTIQRSYEGSLDCPGLNGKRDIEDVVAGHKGTGVFDPALWHLVRENGEDRGVLILSPSPHTDTVELVYLGLCPEARRRGVSDALMKLAIHQTLRQRKGELSLAVDARNTPALRLYYRHGLKRVGSRLALLRDIRPAPAAGRQPT